MGRDSVRQGGKVLLVAACPDGIGYHALYGPTGQGYKRIMTRRRSWLQHLEVIIFSTGIGPTEVWDVFPNPVKIFRNAEEVLHDLAGDIPFAKVNVFPYGGISILN